MSSERSWCFYFQRSKMGKSHHNGAASRDHQILRAFSSRNVWTLLRAFTTYVRPILEYNSSVWSPYLKKDTAVIESVQKNFSRVICVRCNISFTSNANCLRKLNRKSLEYRRVVADLNLMYKICHILTNLAFSDFFVYRTSVYSLRQHNWTIQSISNTTNHPSSQLLEH